MIKHLTPHSIEKVNEYLDSSSIRDLFMSLKENEDKSLTHKELNKRLHTKRILSTNAEFFWLSYSTYVKFSFTVTCKIDALEIEHLVKTLHSEFDEIENVNYDYNTDILMFKFILV